MENNFFNDQKGAQKVLFLMNKVDYLAQTIIKIKNDLDHM